METELTPGSTAAVARGCTCDPAINRFGKGWTTMPNGTPAYRVNRDCPMHGLAKALEDAMEAGVEDIGRRRTRWRGWRGH